jgi:putative oxidoreductase
MRSLGLLVLRVVTGGLLVAHGYTKLFGGRGRRAPEPLREIYGDNFEKAVAGGGPEKMSTTLEQLDVPAPRLSAYLSGLAEFGGGLAFLLGFRTRTAAPVVLFNMATAIRKVHWDKGIYGEGGFEYPLLMSASALTLMLDGPGAFSLDAMASAARHVHDGADEEKVVA